MNSAHDIIERNITPFIPQMNERSEYHLRQYFSTFPNPVYKELAHRLEFARDHKHDDELWERNKSSDPNNRTAVLKTTDGGRKYWYNYHFSEEIVEMEPLYFEIHILNKKWPLKKVLGKHPYKNLHI